MDFRCDGVDSLLGGFRARDDSRSKDLFSQLRLHKRYLENIQTPQEDSIRLHVTGR